MVLYRLISYESFLAQSAYANLRLSTRPRFTSVVASGGRYVFPPDIEDRLDERERQILARIERLRSTAEAGGAEALASDAPQPRGSERSHG